jgi:hypothetical protein
MHLLDVKLEVDSTRPGSGHAKLQQANIIKSVPSKEQTLDKAIQNIFFFQLGLTPSKSLHVTCV